MAALGVLCTGLLASRRRIIFRRAEPPGPKMPRPVKRGPVGTPSSFEQQLQITFVVVVV